MSNFPPPYEGIDPKDTVLVTQAIASEVVIAANSGRSVDAELVAFVLSTVNEVVSTANTDLLLPTDTPEV